VGGSVLRQLGQEGEAIVHVDPCKPECCHMCAVTPCPVRSEAFRAKPRWKVNLLTAPPNAVRGRGATE
jgi:hypothetical protein